MCAGPSELVRARNGERSLSTSRVRRLYGCAFAAGWAHLMVSWAGRRCYMWGFAFDMSRLARGALCRCRRPLYTVRRSPLPLGMGRAVLLEACHTPPLPWCIAVCRAPRCHTSSGECGCCFSALLGSRWPSAFHWRWLTWAGHRRGRRTFAAVCVRCRLLSTASISRRGLCTRAELHYSRRAACRRLPLFISLCFRACGEAGRAPSSVCRESPLPSGMCGAVCLWRRFHWRWFVWAHHRHGRRPFAAVGVRCRLLSTAVHVRRRCLCAFAELRCSRHATRRRPPSVSRLCLCVCRQACAEHRRSRCAVCRRRLSSVTLPLCASRRESPLPSGMCRAASLEVRRRRRLSSVMLPSCSWLSVVS